MKAKSVSATQIKHALHTLQRALRRRFPTGDGGQITIQLGHIYIDDAECDPVLYEGSVKQAVCILSFVGSTRNGRRPRGKKL